jgi:16S rRNA (cytidine1402-2'-O)-methyltransferase
VLVGTPIGNLGDLSPRAVEALSVADVIYCEDTRRTRKLLSYAGITGTPLVALHRHNEASGAADLVAAAGRGAIVAVVTDAGMPGISDPGERVVRAALDAGIPVDVVPGPSAAVVALVASGIPSGRFVFEGFLPRKGRERSGRLAAVATEERTVVLFEAPHRVRGTLGDLVEACAPERPVAIVRELTKVHEEVWRGDLAGAVEHVAQTEPRGEFVIVLGGATAAPAAVGSVGDVDEGVVEERLRLRFDAGFDRRGAVAAVAAELGLPKRTVYEAALRTKGEQHPT